MPNYCTFPDNTFTPATVGLSSRIFYPCAGVGTVLLSQIQADPNIIISWTAPSSPFTLLRYDLIAQKGNDEPVVTMDVDPTLTTRQYTEADMSALVYRYTIEAIFTNGLFVRSNTLTIKNEPERLGEAFAPSDFDQMTDSEDKPIYVEPS